MNNQNKTIKDLFLTKFRTSYKTFMGFPLNFSNEYLSLLLEDANILIGNTSETTKKKIEERFGKK